MTLPLAGLRVLDLTNVMAGPFCCYQLALLGAEVIKVELPKTGDLARQLGADPGLSQNLMGASFLTQNAGKKSITLNLKDPRGRDLLKRLAGSADALVESFRPGVMIRLGVDAAVLRIEHPRLVYCALSGFGQTGPLSARPAYDQVIQGLSGLMSVTGDETSAPLRVGFPVSDAVAGLNAALAVCAALAHAARTGEGGTIDVSMLESSIAIAAWVVGNYMIAGEEPQPMGNENRTAAPSGVFRTQDGLLNIAANKAGTMAGADAGAWPGGADPGPAVCCARGAQEPSLRAEGDPGGGPGAAASGGVGAAVDRCRCSGRPGAFGQGRDWSATAGRAGDVPDLRTRPGRRAAGDRQQRRLPVRGRGPGAAEPAAAAG
jgi:crotonobetainyl-CoA:carnitine CoA-transferase CaiB-like acyl-CoA transferase